ncbi:hypothetical protein Btru_058749 [Bulinus truncatus]|nr:hypothetical protein Btru_058749 [Bulinus truncatus]
MSCWIAVEIVWLSVILTPLTSGQSYNDTMAIMKDRLNKDTYHTDVRPLMNQKEILLVTVQFELVSIVEVNEVTQSFTCNGFVVMHWVDQLVAWKPEDYGGQIMIHPVPEDIWRPRVILGNTLADRDLFKDDKAPVYVHFNGSVTWGPGGLFHTSCHLSMSKYPFDIHDCVIQLTAMMQVATEMQFVVSSKVGLKLYTSHPEWSLTDTYIKAVNASTKYVTVSTIMIHFQIERKPGVVFLNVILPVVFLSFLNIMVFLIPAKSGEKISYGTTVLMALSMFLSMVSGMLPRSSTDLPRITVYLFLLLIISVLTVVDSILIVHLHHKVKIDGQRHNQTRGFKKATHNKVTALNSSVCTSQSSTRTGLEPGGPESYKTKESDQVMRKFSQRNEAEFSSGHNLWTNSSPAKGDEPATGEPLTAGDERTASRDWNYKDMELRINRVSFCVFLVTWVVITIGYLLDITSVIYPKLLLVIALSASSGQKYYDGLNLMKTKLNNDYYSPDVRPLNDQSAIINVTVSFQLVSIVEVNDVTQSFVCNGFLPMAWTDEIIAWKPSDYGGSTSIFPLPEAVWRPRVVLLNTIDKRDLFDDDKAWSLGLAVKPDPVMYELCTLYVRALCTLCTPLSVDYTGLTHWIPGSLFPTSCELDMTKYPFDEHECSIQMSAMTFQSHELQFVAPIKPEVGMTFYTQHGEWKVTETRVATFKDTSGVVPYASIKVFGFLSLLLIAFVL